MRVPRILSFYVFREVLIYAGLGLLGVGSILITQNLLRRLDDLATVGFSAADTFAVLICAVLVFAYYALLTFGSFLTKEGTLPVSLAIWLPNSAFAAIAVPLLYRARRAEI